MTDPLHGKRVLIIGFGRQGRSLARWLPTVGAKVIVNDGRDEKTLNLPQDEYAHVRFVLGDHPVSLVEEADIVCVSGGVPLELPLIQAAYKAGLTITNDAQLFMERCPAPVIGITGSAGKTTTTRLVGDIMQQSGFRTWVGGNIGDVLLDVLPQIAPQDRVVMELSSFQLELMTNSPQIAAVLNITPNHLDRHGTMENYTAAKANIIAHQRPDDMAILGYDDAGSHALEEAVCSQLLWFSMRDMVADGAFMAGNRLIVAGLASPDGSPRVVCERSEIPLRGDHNILNVLAAMAITGAAGVQPEAMREAICAFKPVPHRLETVRVLDGVTYINDSIATAPERTLAALRSFDEPLILLLGGADKDLPWDDVVKLAVHKARHIIVFGQKGHKRVADKVAEIANYILGAENMISYVPDLEGAVTMAHNLAQKGDVVLLSPGGTSFDAYVDFAERGEHFRRLVMAL